MLARLQKLFLGLNALAMLTCASIAHSEEVLRIPLGFAMTMKIPGAEKGKFIAIVGKPDIADFTYGPKNTFMFIGKREGTTNVIVVDNDSGTEIYNAAIEVGNADHRVKNHNKALLNSFTVYRCTPACEFVNEVTVAEPAPLPRGYSNLQSATTIDSTTPQTLSPSLTIPTSP